MSRLSVDIPDDLYKRFRNVPWGVRRHIVMKILDKVLSLYEQHGENGLGAVLASDFSLSFATSNGQNSATTRKGKKDGKD